MALLVSTRLAVGSIDSLPQDDRKQHLPDVFSSTEHVRRLNRTGEDARAIILDAERQLTYMAIPFVLSVYETYLLDVIDLLRRGGVDSSTQDTSKIGLAKLHEYLETLGLKLNPTDVALFDFIRRLRNRIVHYAGVEGSRLKREFDAMPADAKSLWRYLGGDPPVGTPTEALRLRAIHLTPALAVTNHLGEATNDGLMDVVPLNVWADIAVEDYYATNPPSLDRAQRLRKLAGYTRFMYGPLRIGTDMLVESLDRFERVAPE
jgi:hypothetical protein